jgi:hypothetical protein
MPESVAKSACPLFQISGKKKRLSGNSGDHGGKQCGNMLAGEGKNFFPLIKFHHT